MRVALMLRGLGIVSHFIKWPIQGQRIRRGQDHWGDDETKIRAGDILCFRSWQAGDILKLDGTLFEQA
jgi:hypothetical protein